MVAFHKFKINASLNPSEAFVEMDGVRLHGVRSVSFSLEAGRPTELTLRIFGEVLVEGQFRPDDIVNVRRGASRAAGLAAQSGVIGDTKQG